MPKPHSFFFLINHDSTANPGKLLTFNTKTRPYRRSMGTKHLNHFHSLSLIQPVSWVENASWKEKFVSQVTIRQSKKFCGDRESQITLL